MSIICNDLWDKMRDTDKTFRSISEFYDAPDPVAQAAVQLELRELDRGLQRDRGGAGGGDVLGSASDARLQGRRRGGQQEEEGEGSEGAAHPWASWSCSCS